MFETIFRKCIYLRIYVVQVSNKVFVYEVNRVHIYVRLRTLTRTTHCASIYCIFRYNQTRYAVTSSKT